MEMAKDKGLMLCIYYGSDERALTCLATSPKVQFSLAGDSNTVYEAHVSGSYNYDNIQTAFSIATFFNVNEKECANALASYIPSNNRSQLIEKENTIVHLDAYNANPSSMDAAIHNFGQFSYL